MIRDKSLYFATALMLVASGANAKASVYGQVNRMMVHANDGFQKDTRHVDNDAASSRMGIKGDMELGGGCMVGSILEMELESQSVAASANGPLQLNTGNTNTINIRHVNAWLSNHWGKLTVGRLATAAEGTGEMNKSGAGNAAYSDISAFSGGFAFHKKDSALPVVSTGAITDDPKVGDVLGSIDGHARKDGVRYDTPMWNGLHAAASLEDMSGAGTNVHATGTSLGLFYDKDWDGNEFGLAAGWAKRSKGVANHNPKLYSLSFAWLHQDSGFNAAVNWGKAVKEFSYGTISAPTGDQEDRKMWYFQVGKNFDWSSWGHTNFVVEYAKSDNNLYDNDKGKVYGVAAVQKLDAVNAEMFAFAKKHKFKRNAFSQTARATATGTESLTSVNTAQDYDDLTVVGLGVKVKFEVM